MTDFINYNGMYITDAIVQPNENLLINSDFASGVINQQGNFSYESFGSTMLTYDGWISYGLNCAIMPDNTLLLSSRTMDDSSFTQKRDIKSINNDNTFTAYIDVVQLPTGGSAYFSYTGASGGSKLPLSTGKNIFTITTSSVESFSIILDPDAQGLRIKRMKLERGDQFTGMPDWDKNTELLKCQKYYINLRDIKFEIRGHANQRFTYTMILPTEMVKKPSVSIVGTYSSVSVDSFNSWTNGQVLQLMFRTLTDNMISCNVYNIYLDANDY